MTTLDPTQGIALITDGSASVRNRTGGWGWVAIDTTEGLIHDAAVVPDTTIGRMELMAPTKGLTYLQREHGPCEVLVYSDSEYVVLGATDRSRKRNKNKEAWKRLDDAVAHHTYVEFIHVRGHNNHLYNEMADKLAGTARLERKSSAYHYND